MTIRKTWITTEGAPVQKTRNPFTEIEVRFEGEEMYTYLLEARPRMMSSIMNWKYSGTGNTDYGYDTSSGRIEYYRKSSGDSQNTCITQESGINGEPLKSNTLLRQTFQEDLDNR